MEPNQSNDPGQDTYDINQLTHKIIGCAMQVHKILGNGFSKDIYQNACAIEFSHQNLEFIQQQDKDLYYRDQHIGIRKMDFFVDNRVMVEVKAFDKIESIHRAQAINYCKSYNITDGLLINFGSQGLDFKRVYNNNLVDPKNRVNTVQNNDIQSS